MTIVLIIVVVISQGFVCFPRILANYFYSANKFIAVHTKAIYICSYETNFKTLYTNARTKAYTANEKEDQPRS